MTSQRLVRQASGRPWYFESHWHQTHHEISCWHMILAPCVCLSIHNLRFYGLNRGPDVCWCFVYPSQILKKNDRIPIQISLTLVPRSPIDNKPEPVHVMAWRLNQACPSSLTHVCSIRGDKLMFRVACTLYESGCIRDLVYDVFTRMFYH